jgi:4-diphosphocytidyl-2-C-methyl-D-erythritol kinase
LRIRAFAKINLSLKVLGSRADGYHELRTIFQSVELHDTVVIERVPGPFALTCDDDTCPADETNLVWRAAQGVWRASGKRGPLRNIRIHIAKRIPIRAGLGGGSSDAAAALRALGRLWRVDRARLCAIGGALGADVPYFFEGGTVLGLERGDLLFPLLDRTPAWVVIALPAFGISTADAFRWFDEARAGRQHATSSLRYRRRADVDNDLEPAVARHHPVIGRLVRTLIRAGATQSAMSGSGSAAFGLFRTRAAASAGARAIGRLAPRVLMTRTVDRQAYQRLACK